MRKDRRGGGIFVDVETGTSFLPETGNIVGGRTGGVRDYIFVDVEIGTSFLPETVNKGGAEK